MLPSVWLSVQRRDGCLSQSNCTDSTLLSVLTPPAIVRHLPVLALTSITSLLTGAPNVTAVAPESSTRANTPGATSPVGAGRKTVMMSLLFRNIRVYAGTQVVEAGRCSKL